MADSINNNIPTNEQDVNIETEKKYSDEEDVKFSFSDKTTRIFDTLSHQNIHKSLALYVERKRANLQFLKYPFS